MTIADNRVLRSDSHSDFRSTLLVACVTIGLSYLVPTFITVLVANHKTVWPLWPGCAILVTGLLLVRVSVWPLLIPASFTAFALTDLQAGVPLSSIAWFIPGNTVEVLISALGLRYCFEGIPRLNSVRALAKYSLFAVVLAPLAGAFFSAHGIARDYWTGWTIVVLSEALAFITLTPAVLSWLSEGRALIRRPRAHHLEGLMLIAGLVLVSYIVFTLREDSRSPALFYTLVPFLLWSALRFGWSGVSRSLIVVTSLSIWGAVYGRGPFSNLVPLTNPIPLQMFLIFVSLPFMALAALAEQHEQGMEVVRESEERFRLVANTAPVMIWMSGTDKLCTYFNQPWLEFTGRSLEAELGSGWAEGVHKEDLKHYLETYSLAFDQRRSFVLEYRLRHKDGEYRWIFDKGVPRFNAGGSFAGFIGSCLDITDRKLAEEARFRHTAVIESTEDGIITKDLNSVIVSWNSAAQHLFGYTEAEAVGQPITILFPPDLLDEELKILERLKSGDHIEHYETTRLTKAGKKVDVSLTISPVKDWNGKVMGYTNIAHDITARKQAEQILQETNRALEAQTAALQSREELLKIFVKTVPAGVAMLDLNMRYLQVSDRWCSDYGVNSSQILGRSHYAVFPDMPERWKQIHRRALEGETLRANEDPWDRTSGTTWVRWEVRPWSNALGTIGGILIFAEDITERKQMEEAVSDISRKLIQSQEQERARIGRELHDDINQRLAILAVDLDNLQNNPLETEHRVQAVRQQISQISDDVQALSHELHSSKLEYLGVIGGIKSWCKEFGERQGIEINFKGNVSSPIPSEIGVTLFRILQEGLHNAVKHSGAKIIDVQITEQSNEVQLTISDAGKGFDVEAAKQGSGLGLASMEERVRLVNGKMTLESKPMTGTSIRVAVYLRPDRGAAAG